MNNSRTLSIVIPTRNRELKLKETLFSLCSNLEFLAISDFEIFISDNSENSKSGSLIDEIKHEYRNIPITYWRAPVNFPSAEEHLAWLFTKDYARYVWFLGDDDIPTQEGLVDLHQRLISESEESDLLLYLCRRESDNKFTMLANFPSDVNEQLFTFQDLIYSYGYWSEVCGISNQIIKSEILSSSLMNEIITSAGSIYSHMTHHFIQLKEKRVRLVTIPLVNYHLNDFNNGNEDNWQRHADRANTPIYDPWLMSFLKQIDLLEKKEIVDRYFLRNIFDFEVGTGSRPFVIPLGARIAWFLQRQCFHNHVHKLSRSYTQEEKKWMFNFLSARLPFYINIWSSLLLSNGTPSEPDSYFKYSFDPYWKFSYFGFEVYQLRIDQYLAVKAEHIWRLPYYVAHMNQLCSKHQIVSTNAVSMRNLIESSFEIKVCKCFKITDYFSERQRNGKVTGKKVLISFYRLLPKKTKNWIKNLVSR